MSHKLFAFRTACLIFLPAALLNSFPITADRVTTDAGVMEGTTGKESHIHIYKGIPYAAPPTGSLRWKEPQPLPSWKGTLSATEFGARCMQGPIFSDMVFRDSGPSEDCLYLNVWTPANSAEAHLPVMVWIYGGGFQAGAASEPRQDGENLARKGVVVVSFNYRLNVFGFLAHPALTEESKHNASGNYGLLDQVAALQWVYRNIAAFGGDPQNVTIFGESAGSFSVSGLVASPLAKSLFQRAIGESGSMLPSPGRQEATLAEAEAIGQAFGKSLGADSIAAMRAIPAEKLLQATLKTHAFFWTDIDGYFLPESAAAIYASGKQNHVPLLAGWNANEGGIGGGKPPATVKSWTARAHTMFGDKAEQFLKLFPASDEAEARGSADVFSTDVFIALGTWEWIQAQQATRDSRVYRYHFEQAPPIKNGASRGAYHSAEIEYVFETLDSKDYPWRPEDRKLSDMMSSYWTNFAKSGDPNGSGLPKWPAYSTETKDQVMHLSGTDTHASPAEDQAQYEFLEKNPPVMPAAGH